MVKGCIPCLATTKSYEREPMKHNPLPNGPWQHVSCDYYGPTEKGEYLLVFLDLYSRFPIVRYVQSTNSSAAIRALDNVLAEYGNIERLDTDNAAVFTSEAWTEYVKNKGIKHRKITPLWPQANRAETMMKGIKSTI